MYVFPDLNLDNINDIDIIPLVANKERKEEGFTSGYESTENGHFNILHKKIVSEDSKHSMNSGLNDTSELEVGESPVLIPFKKRYRVTKMDNDLDKSTLKGGDNDSEILFPIKAKKKHKIKSADSNFEQQISSNDLDKSTLKSDDDSEILFPIKAKKKHKIKSADSSVEQQISFNDFDKSMLTDEDSEILFPIKAKKKHKIKSADSSVEQQMSSMERIINSDFHSSPEIKRKKKKPKNENLQNSIDALPYSQTQPIIFASSSLKEELSSFEQTSPQIEKRENVDEHHILDEFIYSQQTPQHDMLNSSLEQKHLIHSNNSTPKKKKYKNRDLSQNNRVLNKVVDNLVEEKNSSTDESQDFKAKKKKQRIEISQEHSVHSNNSTPKKQKHKDRDLSQNNRNINEVPFDNLDKQKNSKTDEDDFKEKKKKQRTENFQDPTVEDKIHLSTKNKLHSDHAVYVKKEKKKYRKENSDKDTTESSLEHSLHSNKKKKKLKLEDRVDYPNLLELNQGIEESILDILSKQLNNFNDKPKKKKHKMEDESVEGKHQKRKLKKENSGVTNLDERHNSFEEYNSQDNDSKKIRRKKKHIKEETTLDSFYNTKLTDEDQEKLTQLYIKENFSVARLHQLLTRCTRPTKQQNEEIECLGIEVKNGIFSKAEDQIIKDNWRKFIKEYNFEDNPNLFLSFDHKGIKNIKNRERTKFLQYIAQKLDSRTLNSVYNRFKRIFRNGQLKTGRYTKEEDETILNYLATVKPKYSYLRELAKRLNRDKLSVEKRILLLTKNNYPKHIKWDEEKIKEFIENLLHVTKCSSHAELKDKVIKLKHWKKLSKKLDGVPIKRLKGAWNNTIYPKLFIEKDIDLNDIKTKLIKKMYKRNEDDWRTVDWKKYASYFEGLTPERTYFIFKRLVKLHVPRSKVNDLKESLHFLKNVFLPNCNLSDYKTRYTKLRKIKIQYED